MSNASSRDVNIDLLKGIAILAVIFYHLWGNGVPFGYLGVDMFLVISGYLMMTGILKAIEKGAFSYWRYLFRRVLRLWPAVLLIAAVSLLAGYFLMLPDDYENLAESAIASSLFLNNVLGRITTGNYWDVVNTYKPLMHTWYLGVLMQAYMCIPALIILCFRLKHHSQAALKSVLWFITFASLAAYLLPFASDASKFYYLPYRAFELTAGALLALYLPSDRGAEKTKFLTVSGGG